MTRRADPHEGYRARAAECAEDAARLERASRRLGTIRFGVFFAALAPWVTAELSAGIADSFGWLSVPVAAVFFVLVGRHRRLRARLRRAQVAASLARQGSARLERRWDDLSEPVAAVAPSDHPWAHDLDLYGRASLRSLLGPVYTPVGHAELDRWLLEPWDAAEALRRQEAVRELRPLDELRERAGVEGALLDRVDPQALARFLEWCGTPGQVPRWLSWVAWIGPAIFVALVVGHATGITGPWLWTIPLAVQGVLAWGWGHRLHETFGRASSGLPGLRRYHKLFAVWEGERFESPLLSEAEGALRSDSGTASEALARLDRLLQMADTRLSSLHPVFAICLLWDVHVGRGMDEWRRSAGSHVAEWMRALGDLEAAASVATLASDHPDWTFPAFLDPGVDPIFEAAGLGHPLIPDAVRVANDVTLGPPGAVLLVTGSNMSGKSTLLRSLGLSVVLAGLGGPVCAERVRLSTVRLFTSMRVQDSIEAGVSFFMAELNRLAALLRITPPAESEGPAVLYLVDEILQGTNSDERRIAGRRLIRHLLRRRAIGAVTTHDLDFHRHPEIESAAVKVHFRESVGTDEDPSLTFDYRLRSGLATTRNALALAERVGLTDPDDGGADDGGP
ncbi:MAG: hypothetical protein KJO11_16775 [Gemmatimonadetes bacterium]|nr:hypothetical protein [Gemmatimonadota bacterium]